MIQATRPVQDLVRPSFSELSSIRRWEILNGNSPNATTTVMPRWRNSCAASAVGFPYALRQHLETQAHDTLKQLEPDDERYNEIPPEYCAAFPLDYGIHATQVAGSFGYLSSIYKVIDRRSGLPYALRRVDGARVSQKVTASVQSRWRAVCHSNIISLRRIFVHGGATYFVHQYWPCAQSLLQYHFAPSTQDGTSLIDESCLWSYLLQLVTATRTIHAATMACRGIGLSRILITSSCGRIRLGGVGVTDVLEYDACKSVADGQRDDILALGHVILALATRPTADSTLVRQYSARHAIMHCLNHQRPPKIGTLFIRYQLPYGRSVFNKFALCTQESSMPSFWSC
mmetsp:Transcript_31166/g.101179  ORF Transcript_31166/g.101179 Transcript_31166/m.101179 type:complete len:343 (+) Transcript_31166:312-1340(+)